MLAILTSHPIQYQAPLWRALAKDGRVPFEVWFLTDHAVKPSHDREFGKQFAWDRDLLEGYPHRFLPVRPGWRMDRFRGIRVVQPWAKLLKEGEVTQLWVEGWRFWENWAAIFEARRLGVEVWMRGETNDLRRRGGAKEIVRRCLLAQLFSRVSRFLCIGSANRRFYRSFGVGNDRLLSTPYCVENGWFAGQAENLRNRRSEIRRGWGIDDDAFCVVFCGKFISKKRPMDLVEAAKLLIGKNSGLPKVHLLFVGSGILGDSLRSACHVVFDAENPSSQHTNINFRDSTEPSPLPTSTFTGFLNQGEISRAYVAADCLVLPSDAGETWGLVVNEAMAAGLPCVVSNQCGCAEDLISAVSPTAVYPAGNVAALATALEDAITCPVESSVLSRHIAGFDISRTVDTVAALAEKVAP